MSAECFAFAAAELRPLDSCEHGVNNPGISFADGSVLGHRAVFVRGRQKRWPALAEVGSARAFRSWHGTKPAAHHRCDLEAKPRGGVKHWGMIGDNGRVAPHGSWV